MYDRNNGKINRMSGDFCLMNGAMSYLIARANKLPKN